MKTLKIAFVYFTLLGVLAYAQDKNKSEPTTKEQKTFSQKIQDAAKEIAKTQIPTKEDRVRARAEFNAKMKAIVTNQRKEERLALARFLANTSPTTKRSSGVIKIPFRSKDFPLQLVVENTSTNSLSGVAISSQQAPAWARLSDDQFLGTLKPGEQREAQFTLSIDQTAPPNTEQTIAFLVTTVNSGQWLQEVTVDVQPPDRFELFQNYPNPFNPTTMISFQLPADSRVVLRIYNLLGQEVATLIDGQMTAGYYRQQFDAARFASGVYVYRLKAESTKGTRNVGQGKMLLLK